MPTHLILLRGVNVGRSTRVPMARLRELVAEQGHRDVTSYLQSGNLVLTPAGKSTPDDLAEQVRRVVGEEFGLTPVVVVLTATEWDEVVAGSPYGGQDDPTKVHAAVQQDVVPPEQRDELERVAAEVTAAGSPDELHVHGRTVYLHTPAGFGRSLLAERLARSARRTGQDRATARNWRTVLALQELLRG